MSRDLSRLFDPSTIAVVGGGPAAQAIAQSDRLGFEGQIWPVHPAAESIGGRSVFREVGDLPAPPDATFIAVNRTASVELVRDLAEMGAGGAVLYASGFAESGAEGARLQARLIEGHDMPLIGPNCYGTINSLSGAAMWPDVHGCRRVERGPAFLSQSGNVALNMTMNRRGVDFARVLSVGNQASVTIEEAIVHLADDPRITSIGLYLESIVDPIGFGEAALIARSAATPLVALRTGRTATATTIAGTHSAALASPAEAYDALFARYGVVTVDTLPELLTVLGMWDTIGPLPGNRLISLSCSGGEASLVADRAEHHDVRFDPIDADHARRIGATLSDLVAMSNPLDYHTFIWGDGAALEACFTEALDGPVDAGMLILDWPSPDNDDADWWPTLEAIGSASHKTGRPAVVVATLPENLPAFARDHLAGKGLGVAYSIDEALAGLAAMASLGRPIDPVIHERAGPAAAPLRTMSEVESKAVLATAGIAVPRGEILDAGEPADLAFPVTAKRLDVAHKTDEGGVILSIDEPAALATAIEWLGGRALVETMITGAVVELLVAVRREPTVGVVLTIGAGGTLVELFDDRATVLAPSGRDPLFDALRSLRIWPTLDGHRGRPAGHIDSVLTALGALQNLMQERPDIVEIEINPLIVTPTGAWAVDALIEVSP